MLSPAEIQSRVLFRDHLMIVIDKPAGLPVHAGPGGGDNLENHFIHLRFEQTRNPGLAHRLDRDTSGCLILGRKQKGLSKLGRLFMQKRIDKTYWAVVHGKPKGGAGRIDLPLRKLTPKGGWKMVVDAAEGQSAVTDWRLMGSNDEFCWLELYPRTGRTHQIRVHCAEIGCPLVGDPVYGRTDEAGPLMLHARKVVIPLYATKDPITVEAPVPPHMLTFLESCGYSPD